MGGRRGEIDVIFIGFPGELDVFYTIHVVLIMGKISDTLVGVANLFFIFLFFFPIKTTTRFH